MSLVHANHAISFSEGVLRISEDVAGRGRVVEGSEEATVEGERLTVVEDEGLWWEGKKLVLVWESQ